MTELRGITWNHTRGYLPMVATAQRFAELNPGVAVRWEKRSLQQFADSPVEKLAERYDLVVIDHPFAGYAAAHGVLVPLDEHLPADFLADQAAHSVGGSHASYCYGSHQWALAIDAATPVSGFRRDLLERAGERPPATWAELMALTRRGLVAVPGLAIDSLMLFLMLCLGLGEEPCVGDGEVVSHETGSRALDMMRELFSLCDAACLARNPIATWDMLAASSSVAYCPFAYGYSNYARPGYGRHLLQFGGLVSLEPGAPSLRSVLGGAGLAVSRRCEALDLALRYCAYAAGPACQRTLYFDAGGQPGHREAWTDGEVNRRSGDFFANTLKTLDEAWVRPRYDGYLHFQDEAAPRVHACLRGEATDQATLDEINRLYQASRRTN